MSGSYNAYTTFSYDHQYYYIEAQKWFYLTLNFPFLPFFYSRSSKEMEVTGNIKYGIANGNIFCTYYPTNLISRLKKGSYSW